MNQYNIKIEIPPNINQHKVIAYFCSTIAQIASGWKSEEENFNIRIIDEDMGTLTMVENTQQQGTRSKEPPKPTTIHRKHDNA